MNRYIILLLLLPALAACTKKEDHTTGSLPAHSYQVSGVKDVALKHNMAGDTTELTISPGSLVQEQVILSVLNYDTASLKIWLESQAGVSPYSTYLYTRAKMAVPGTYSATVRAISENRDTILQPYKIVVDSTNEGDCIEYFIKAITGTHPTTWIGSLGGDPAYISMENNNGVKKGILPRLYVGRSYKTIIRTNNDSPVYFDIDCNSGEIKIPLQKVYAGIQEYWVRGDGYLMPRTYSYEINYLSTPDSSNLNYATLTIKGTMNF
ncbi:MAG: hypothetical protein H6550_10040 [Chitinophagales bacterium]|nr:hypothetical protein [Chitinophagales bacterium]